jgi:hypothetical protein
MHAGRIVLNFFRSMWSSIEVGPTLIRRVHGWLTVLWIAMIPVSIWLGWLHSVAYVSCLSLWALVSGHWSAWQASRVEVEQQRVAAEAAENPIEEKVVDRIMQETEVRPA